MEHAQAKVPQPAKAKEPEIPAKQEVPVSTPALRLLQLQRTVGNRAVQGLIQAKLEVSQPGDPYEQEADDVAQRIMTMRTMDEPPADSRQPIQDGKGEEEEKQRQAVQLKPLAVSVPMFAGQDSTSDVRRRFEPIHKVETQRAAIPDDERDKLKDPPEQGASQMPVGPVPQPQEPAEEEKDKKIGEATALRTVEEAAPNGVLPHAEEAVAAASNSTGQPLPANLHRKFERALGADLSAVRVHTGSQSVEASKAISARAFTTGEDIHFNEGQYNPDDSEGQQLLAHELVHTVQQRGPTKSYLPPGDTLELEGDQSAASMVTAVPFEMSALRGRLGRRINRASLGEEMEKGANYEEAHTEAGGIVVGESSSVWSADEARRMQNKVKAASGNLNHRLAHWQRKKDEAKGGGWKELTALDVEVTGNIKKIAENEKVISTLQDLINMSEGNSQLNEKGENTAGYDFRSQMFHGLVATCRRDFARLQGVANAFLAANPKFQEQGGRDGGAEMGRAIAGGDTTATHSKIVAASASDKQLDDLLQNYKSVQQALTTANYPTEIEKQMGKCASEKSALRNLTTNVSLGTQRPETPEEETAKKEVDTINADLASAKGFLDKVEGVLKKVATVAVGPAVGAAITAAGEKMPDIRDLVKDSGKALDLAGVDAGGVIEKGIGDYVKTEIAKVMSDYETRIDTANGKVKTLKLGKLRIEAQFNFDSIKVAKGKVVAEANALGETLAKMAAKKAELRSVTARILDYQKKNKRPGQPDIAGMTQALTETSSFLVQADSAILQGKEEGKLFDKMREKRKAVAGEDFKVGTEKEAFTGTKEVTNTSKEQAYTDCENEEPFLYSQHPLTYRIWEDNQKQTFEGSHNDIEPQLKELEQVRETAAGMEIALKNAMFGQ